MDKVQALARLLQPARIAVIGGDSAAEVVRQCRGIGFGGELYAVNPRRSELGGVPCVPRIEDLPALPDASFIAAPPLATLDLVRELAAIGAPGAVCFAAGFGETDGDGLALERELREAAGHMAVMGPNCHGYLNYLDNIALWPDQHGGRHCEKGVAIISQSGNIAINLTMQQRGLDLAYVISVGNCSVLGVHDYIEALLRDGRVTAIGLLIEGIDDVAAFSRAAITALRKGVPLVAFKNGRSPLGAEIARTHTGSLAGGPKLYQALFARCGIAACDTLSQFLETLKFLSVVGVLPGADIGSLSCSGGDAAIVADNAARLGLATPTLSATSAEKLAAILGPNVAVANPLDYHLYIWGDIDKLGRCFEAFLDNAYACTVLVLDYPSGGANDDTSWRITEQALMRAIDATGQRAVIVASLPETMPAAARDRLKAAGIAAMQGIEDCLFAIRAAARIGAAQSTSADIVPVRPSAPALGAVVTLDEWQSKRALATFGVTVPDGAVGPQDEVANLARRLGYPVVLKALSGDLLHKSDTGAVVLDIGNEMQLLDACDKIAVHTQRFLVERMLSPVVAELIVGVSRDPVFGLTLLLGSGGTLVELVRDTVTLLLPVRREDLDAAVATLAVDKLIGGYRGAPAADRAAMLDAIEAIVAYATGNAATLEELDVNPLLLMPDAAVAADAVLRVHRSPP